ncbi:MAG: hypothetical protein PHV83_08195, partial [Bacteroidales bacterium]|nr:hypothetical protein [Bacteroidales bacterium]
MTTPIVTPTALGLGQGTTPTQNIVPPAIQQQAAENVTPTRAGLGLPEETLDYKGRLAKYESEALASQQAAIQAFSVKTPTRGVTPTYMGIGGTPETIPSAGKAAYVGTWESKSEKAVGGPDTISGTVETRKTYEELGGDRGGGMAIGEWVIISHETPQISGTKLSGDYRVVEPVSELYTLTQTISRTKGSAYTPIASVQQSTGYIVDKNFDIYEKNAAGVYVRTGENAITKINAAAEAANAKTMSDILFVQQHSGGTVAQQRAASAAAAGLNPYQTGTQQWWNFEIS